MGKCTCLTARSWDGCAYPFQNNGGTPCTSYMQCVDKIYGHCNTTCKCKAGYLWRDPRCVKPNDGSLPCDSNYECYINNGYGGCYNGRCSCIALWNSTRYSCNTPQYNDAWSRCTTIRDCWDQTRGLCNVNCTCQAGTTWSYPKCRVPNNGVSTCTIDHECYDPYGGQCLNGKCVCRVGYAYSGSWYCYSTSSSPPCRENNGCYCSRTSDCMDNVNGYCISNRCWCRMGAVWQGNVKKCLVPNDGSGSCSMINDCMDSVNGMCTGVCQCRLGYEWSRYRNKCGKVNNGLVQCMSTGDCMDVSDGACIAGFCGCLRGIWDDFNQYCSTSSLKSNRDSSSCQSLIECVDQVNGECNFKCKCKPGYTYSSRYDRCGKPNDGLQTCSSNYDCLDLKNGVCSGGKCICKSGTSLVSTGECGGFNNGMNLCSGSNDCYINNHPGTCSNSYCTCVTGYVWHDPSRKCTNLKPNDNTQNCSSSFECADNTYGECSAEWKCVCKPGFSWSIYQYSCKKPNDNTLACTSRAECLDSTLGECIMGLCGCPSGSFWLSSQRRCVSCPAGCMTCSDFATCGSCFPGYSLPVGVPTCQRIVLAEVLLPYVSLF